MHLEFRKLPEARARIWFFRWGFGLWLGRYIFTTGHDVRGRIVSAP